LHERLRGEATIRLHGHDDQDVRRTLIRRLQLYAEIVHRIVGTGGRDLRLRRRGMRELPLERPERELDLQRHVEAPAVDESPRSIGDG